MAALTTDDVQKSVEKAIKPIKEQVSELHGVFFGNGGTPGIKTEVAIIKTRLALVYVVLGLISGVVLAVAGKLLVGHFGG